jgi:hypothetical protein
VRNELLPKERAVGIEEEWENDMGFQNDHILPEYYKELEQIT